MRLWICAIYDFDIQADLPPAGYKLVIINFW